MKRSRGLSITEWSGGGVTSGDNSIPHALPHKLSLSLFTLWFWNGSVSLALSHSRAFSRPHARTLAHTHARTHSSRLLSRLLGYGKIAKRMPKFTSQQNLKPPGGMLSLAWNSNCPSTSVGAKSSSPLSPCAQTNSRSNDFIRMDKPRAAQKQYKLRQSVIRNWVTPAPRHSLDNTDVNTQTAKKPRTKKRKIARQVQITNHSVQT